MQNTLRITHFQAQSSRQINTEFPSLQTPPHQDPTGEEPAPIQLEPQVLSRSTQRKAIKKFSAALTNRFCTDQEKHEKRQQRYYHLAHPQNRTRDTPSNFQVEQNSPRHTHKQHTSHHARSHPPERAPRKGRHITDLITRLLSDKKALILLITALRVIVTTPLTQGDHLDPEQIEKIHKQLQQTLNDPRMDTESEVSMESD